MSDQATRHAHYLESLTCLHRGWAHETRSHLGNISLQLDLMAELVARAAPGAGGAEERLQTPIERARKGVARLEACLDRYLGAALPRAAAGAGALDLGTALAELGELMAPSARDRRVTWSLSTPEAPLSVAGDPGAIRESLAIAAIGRVMDASEGSKVEVRAERAGAVARVRFAGGDSPLELEFPLAQEPR